MHATRRQGWVRAALVVGVFYLLVGRVFALPADNVHLWRLAAWAVCGCAYAAHIAYEHFLLRNAPRWMALHVAVAVAIGGFGLAVAGMLHSLSTGPTIRPEWFLALVLFPAFTAIPAFLGALAAGTLLTRVSRPAGTEPPS